MRRNSVWLRREVGVTVKERTFLKGLFFFFFPRSPPSIFFLFWAVLSHSGRTPRWTIHVSACFHGKASGGTRRRRRRRRKRRRREQCLTSQTAAHKHTLGEKVTAWIPGGFSIQQWVCKCHLVFCPNTLLDLSPCCKDSRCYLRSGTTAPVFCLKFMMLTNHFSACSIHHQAV